MSNYLDMLYYIINCPLPIILVYILIHKSANFTIISPTFSSIMSYTI